jgi:hypothetical protein
MTVRVSGTPFDDIVPGLQKALDTALAGTLNLQQGALAKACPKDTGRMASSFFVGQNTPPRETRPEGWGQPGEARVEIEEYSAKIEFDGTWYLSNAVPYAEYVAFNYKPSAGKAQKDWYTSVANQTGNVFARQFRKVAPR